MPPIQQGAIVIAWYQSHSVKNGGGISHTNQGQSISITSNQGQPPGMLVCPDPVTPGCAAARRSDHPETCTLIATR